MGQLKKLKLVLWKNFLLIKRRPIGTIIEVSLPILIVLILFIMRVTLIKVEYDGAQTWTSFKINNKISISSHPAKWKLAISPNNSFTQNLKKILKKNIDVEGIDVFDDEESIEGALVTDAAKLIPKQSYLCGIVFHDLDDSLRVENRNYDYKYSLRFPSHTRSNKIGALSKWLTDFVFPFTFAGLGPRNPRGFSDPKYGGPPPYYKEGFLNVQKAVDFSIIEATNSSFDSSLFQVSMNRYPYPPRIRDPFIGVLQNSFPLLFMLSFVFTAVNIVKDVVIEKERRLKESMKMMGLSGWLHWTAWFIRYFSLLTITILIMSLMLCVNFGEGNNRILNRSDGSLIFVFLLLYLLTTITFSFFVSTLFYRASISAAGSGVIWFFMYVPYFFMVNYYNQLTTTAKVLSCLDFQLAMSLGANLIGRYEGQGAGVQWSNLMEGVTVDDTFTFGQVLGMMVLDCFIYGMLAWYIEGVFPGEFGIRKKWYFPFTKKYWLGTNDPEKEMLMEESDEEHNIGIDSDYIEKEPENLNVGISIDGLRKEFKTGSETKVAVDGVQLKFYQGQITSLLGHNGAGKTTTISMLTGLIPPTSGSATVGGYDIRNNMQAVRESLGICPQHNVLFDLLTVEEHLWFFTCLKGVDDPQLIKKEVDRMIESIGLLDKRHAQSKTLSGGMKRKLSVGIALVGNSKIVILDEPTSGMDVAARRSTWDLLQKERRDRTILLTTHFMDEADVLGDRIAILSKGQIKCCGSSLFLKKKYGVGYHMVMVKEKTCDVDQVTNVITKYVPTAKLESNVGLELSFVLPSDHSNRFEELFSEIEESRQKLKISSYGASVTTLEEVFMKVKEEDDLTDDTHQKLFRRLSGKSSPGKTNPGYDENNKASVNPQRLSQNQKNNSTSNPISWENAIGFTLKELDHMPNYSPQDGDVQLPSLTGSISKYNYANNMGITLFFQRWYAMFVKRLIHSKRHKISIVSQLLVPAINLMIALIVVRTMPKAQDSPPLAMNLNMFEKSEVPLYIHKGTPLSEELRNSFQRYLGSLQQSSNVPQFVDSNMTKYLIEQEIDHFSQFNRHNLVGLEFKEKYSRSYSTVWFNNEALHSPAVAMNTLSNTLLNLFTNNQEKKIITINEPLPTTASEGLLDLKLNPNGFQIGFALCFGMSFLASSFIVFLVQERASKAKHVQFVSGVDPLSYWTSAYAWDVINFFLPTIVIVLIFFIIKVDAFQGVRIGYAMLVVLLYGWGIIPVMYIFSFLFNVASTAYTRMTMLNIITGLIMLLVVFIFNIPVVNLLDEAKILSNIFIIFPNFSLGQALINIFNNYSIIEQYDNTFKLCVDTAHKMYPFLPIEQINKQCKTMIEEFIPDNLYTRNYFSWDEPGIGRYLLAMAIEGFVYFAIVLMIEYGVFRPIGRCCRTIKRTATTVAISNDINNEILDDDVKREQELVASKDYNGNEVLVLENLMKSFNTNQGELTAVNNISLRVPHGECFGLLGQNGAGKTTTFKMLTGDETPTSGAAYVERFDVARELAEVRQRVGYCPQFDALIDLMTGRELLIMYSRLRGVPEKHIQKLVEDLASNLGVFQYIDKCTKTYSGGNKRKLSTAIALAGDPPLIFLDEPSSGMDPAARRNLWDSLSDAIAGGKSIVITSHSMEECEALCTRLAIMVNGQFKCLGSPQHLKAKFGDGYTLIARIGGINRNTSSLKEFIEKSFPGSILKDEHQGYVQYQLTDKTKTWANLFGIMEKAKETYNIEDYSISQATLEQIFLNFTRTQRVTEDD